MAQNEERARAVKQARKLMNMTSERGASEAETDLAMKRLQKIRETFNLTLDEIVINSLDYQDRQVDQTQVKGCPMRFVTNSIARFTDTKVWSEPGKYEYDRALRYRPKGIGTYRFFGIESDVEMAEYLYNLIVMSLKTAEKVYMRSPEYTGINIRGGKRRALVSFRKGFIRRIESRLVELWLENRQTDQAQFEATGNDIVLLKDKVRDQKFKEQIGIKLVRRKNYTRGITDGSAAANGAGQAENVNFNPPVEGAASPRQKLLG